MEKTSPTAEEKADDTNSTHMAGRLEFFAIVALLAGFSIYMLAEINSEIINAQAKKIWILLFSAVALLLAVWRGFGLSKYITIEGKFQFQWLPLNLIAVVLWLLGIYVLYFFHLDVLMVFWVFVGTVIAAGRPKYASGVYFIRQDQSMKKN